MAKLLAPALSILLLGAFGAARAQSEGAIALTRKMIETDRQAIVAENLRLNGEQEKAFWPLYRQYMAERRATCGWRAPRAGSRQRLLRGDYTLRAWSDDGRAIAVDERKDGGRRWDISAVLLPEALRTPPR